MDPIRQSVIHFFKRGDTALTCETRLNPDGPGYQLIVDQGGDVHTETFAVLAELLAREHELLQAWRAQGWRDVGPQFSDEDAGRRRPR